MCIRDRSTDAQTERLFESSGLSGPDAPENQIMQDGQQIIQPTKGKYAYADDSKFDPKTATDAETVETPSKYKPQTVKGKPSLAEGNTEAIRNNQHTMFDTTNYARTQYGHVQFHPTEKAGGGPATPSGLDIFRFAVKGEKQQFIRRYELEKLLGKKNLTAADIMAFDPTKYKRVDTGEKNLLGVDVGKLVPKVDEEAAKKQAEADKKAKEAEAARIAKIKEDRRQEKQRKKQQEFVAKIKKDPFADRSLSLIHI